MVWTLGLNNVYLDTFIMMDSFVLCRLAADIKIIKLQNCLLVCRFIGSLIIIHLLEIRCVSSSSSYFVFQFRGSVRYAHYNAKYPSFSRRVLEVKFYTEQI